MSSIVIGAIAHVDAGKTTLSEAVLYEAGVLRKRGRVDHEDAFLDYFDFEREKGITVFSKEARFSYGGKDFVYLDTPGHLDFYGEVNRSLSVLDAAILIIDGSSLLPSDTIHRFRTLQSYGIPLLLFVNKMDISHRTKEEVLDELKEKLSPSVLPYEEVNETLSLQDEKTMEEYLSTGLLPKGIAEKAMKEGEVYPLFFGSALKGEGVKELMEYLSFEISSEDHSDESLKAYIYKIDDFVHLKVFSGVLKNRMAFGEAKINQLLLQNGNRYEPIEEVKGSDLCAVKGLNGLTVGTWLPSLHEEKPLPLQTLTVALYSDLDPNEFYRKIAPLSDEMPELKIRLKDSVLCDITGDLQKDLIRKILLDRYKIAVSFSDPLIEYRESVEEEVYGVGHYEPLRHYGEVLVKIRPNDDYYVKASRDYAVLAEYLRNYRPCGLLSDSPLDKVEIEILAVRTHPKHTEGGDLVQALNRAIRQALMKTRGRLLEPYLLVSLQDESQEKIIRECANRKLVFDIEEDGVMAKVSESMINDFIIDLKQRCKDTLSYSIEGRFYDPCQNEDEILKRIDYDYHSDASKPAGSIFTRNGAGTYIPPEEVEENMHILLEDYIKKDVSSSPARYSRTVREEELKRVWDSLYKPRPRYVERRRNGEDEDRRKIDLTPPKPLLYLIDGYNLLHASEGIPLDNLLIAREKIIDLTADFSGYVDARCVLVYDAWKTEERQVHSEERDGITIVYTKKGQTADTYIEAKSKELEKSYRVIVVTSDALEQVSIFSSGAQRLSSREFLMRYQNFRKNMKHIEKSSNRPLEGLKELLEDE